MSGPWLAIRVWELAPAYDVTHAHNPRGEWTYQHLMSVNGKCREVTRADLLVEADRFGVRRPGEILADVRRAVGGWAGFAREAGLGSTAVGLVAADLRPA